MLRRIFPGASALLAATTLSASAFASPHVIRQWTSPPRAGAVVCQLGLAAGHRYRIQVTSQGRVKFTAVGTESLAYEAHGRPGMLDKSLSFKGTTPYTYTLKQPGKIHALEWLFGLQVGNAARKSMTVKFIDLG